MVPQARMQHTREPSDCSSSHPCEAPGMSRRRLLAGIALMPWFSACSSAPWVRAAWPGHQWLAPQLQDHPLVGETWQMTATDAAFGGRILKGDPVQHNQQVDLPQWLTTLPEGAWLMLGEQHDHPDHHQIERQVIQWLADQGRLGNVAFEMAPQSLQPQLNAALGLGDEITAEMLNWPEAWPWADYGPVVRTALNQAMRVVATDLDRDAQQLAYHQGPPRPALTPAQAQALDALIDAGHCGYVPKAQLPMMRQVQLARDQAMAQALLAATQPERINVMVCGRVHARQDIGISRWLPGKQPVFSIALTAVEADQLSAGDYWRAGMDGLPRFDLYDFTPAMPPHDHCAELARSLGHEPTTD